MHNKPTISQTILIPNMYQNPVLNAPLGPDGLPRQVAADEIMEHYEARASAAPLWPPQWHAPCTQPTAELPARGILQEAIIAHHHAELLAEEPHTRARHTMQDFYEDVFEELAIYGEVENLAVCDNVADHLVGNVYAKFREEEAAAKAVAGLTGRYYAGRPVAPEFSPVSDFRESTCRQYEENTCNRGGYCNFMHIKPISKCVST